jgi:hypothetical protein
MKLKRDILRAAKGLFHAPTRPAQFKRPIGRPANVEPAVEVLDALAPPTPSPPRRIPPTMLTRADEVIE